MQTHIHRWIYVYYAHILYIHRWIKADFHAWPAHELRQVVTGWLTGWLTGRSRELTLQRFELTITEPSEEITT